MPPEKKSPPKKKSPSRQKSLVVVESPAKARTIGRFLGSSYVVKASMGHIRDLPKSKLGVDLEKDFEPQYVTVRGKTKAIKELKAAAAKAGDIYLAPDMDREGEAIAWHLGHLLDKTGERTRRVIFNEITKKAIKEAFENPTGIDMRKVDAQQARRILDRLVGYQVSPKLWEVLYKGTSAGRVQSVALRLVCEREAEIRKFVSEEYWTVDGQFQTPGTDTVVARLDKIEGKKAEIKSQERADEVDADIKKQSYAVRDVEKKAKRRNPRPPFITSTLQQDSARRLRFSARKTMVIAQELYEGIDIGEKGRVGLITYMRTDSVRVAADAVDAAKKFIVEKFGKEYVPAKAARYRKAKGAQDAHEAIRPTDVNRVPDELSSCLTRDQLKIYKLVWDRFVASQMAQALFDVTTVEIEGGAYLFKATGTVMKFPGFLKVYSEKAEEKDTRIPVIAKSESLDLLGLDIRRHETQPPPRYTEASLIKDLEDKGIGRPSTYATIISTVLERNYVIKEKTALKPTDLGETVMTILLKVFSDIFDVGFTARMETELDKVESGEDKWVEVVRSFHGPLSASLERFDTMKDEIKRTVEEIVDEKCPKCGSAMLKKWGRFGKFLACSAFPECKSTKPIEGEETATDELCPDCGGEMIVRMGRYGRFLACKRYPECKGTKPYTLGIKCPEEGCDGDVVEKRVRRGIFYGCSNYPECKFASWNKPVGEPCPECNHPIMVVKTTRDKGSHLACPKCGSEAKS